jgi:hypothetical protein
MVDRTQQRPNNTDWLPSAVWDNISEMDKIAGFQGIVSSFEQVYISFHMYICTSIYIYISIQIYSY